MEWTNDTELFRLMRQHLFTAVIGDVLDLHGFHHQFLMPECRPLDPRMVVCGRAMTVHETDVVEVPDPPFGLMLKALDSMREDEVYVAAGSSPRYALWGELMSAAARARGAVGAVMAGYARDTSGILAMEFPVFCYGGYAQDQRGRGQVVDYRMPLEINGVTIQPGDIVFGDIDGLVVLPREAEAAVVERALEQVRKEKTARTMLLQGATAESVFSETGVL
ncbi:MAG TPA: RraA family protein [Acidobacteriaceae bacterium]|jgi:regulator of RNase E activity RraA|nr:RraA family protein [Acidobacteriaceae bacterium]